MSHRDGAAASHDGRHHSRRNKYTSIACLECQRRKSKCSGDAQCVLCRKRRVSCIYPTNQRRSYAATTYPPNERRNSRRSPELNATSDTVTRPALLPRLHSTHGDGESLAGIENSVTHEAREDTLGASECEAQEPGISMDTLARRVHELEAALRLISEFSLRQSTTPTPSSSSFRASCIPFANGFATYQQGVDQEYPNSEPAHRLCQGMSIPALLSATGNMLGLDPLRDQHLTQRGTEASLPVRLPGVRYLQDLTDVCLRKLSLYLPDMELDKIRDNALRTIPAITSTTRNSSEIISIVIEPSAFILFSLFYITLALGRCLLGPPAADPGRSEEWLFYNHSNYLIKKAPTDPARFFDIAKYYLLRATFLLQEDSLQPSILAIWSAVQFAWQDKLNDQPSWPAYEPREIMARKRLFWALYCIDRAIAQACGKPPIFQDDEISVDDMVPKETLITCQETEFLPDGVDMEDLYLQILVDINRMWGRIWDMFLQPKRNAPDEEEADIMDLRISHFQGSLPLLLRWNSEAPQDARNNPQAELQVSRRLIIYVRLNLLRLSIRQNPSKATVNSPSMTKLCETLVLQIIEAIESLVFALSPDRVASLASFINFSLIECSYHIAYIFSKPNAKLERSSASEMLHRVLTIYRVNPPTTDIAKRALAILSLKAAEIASVEAGNTRKASEIQPDQGGTLQTCASAPASSTTCHPKASSGLEFMNLDWPGNEMGGPLRAAGDMNSPSAIARNLHKGLNGNIDIEALVNAPPYGSFTSRMDSYMNDWMADGMDARCDFSGLLG